MFLWHVLVDLDWIPGFRAGRILYKQSDTAQSPPMLFVSMFARFGHRFVSSWSSHCVNKNLCLFYSYSFYSSVDIVLEGDPTASTMSLCCCFADFSNLPSAPWRYNQIETASLCLHGLFQSCRPSWLKSSWRFALCHEEMLVCLVCFYGVGGWSYSLQHVSQLSSVRKSHRGAQRLLSCSSSNCVVRTVGWLASIFQKLLPGIEVESTTSPMPAQAGWLGQVGL